ncbi:MAG: hypothetical protein R2864_02210 [Syntrophotaleaceae bacterium]
MKQFILPLLLLLCAGLFVNSPALAAPSEAVLTAAVKNYFTPLFAGLETAARQQPTVDTFRETIKPLVADLDGFFGSTLIDSDFVIRQTYLRRNFLAVGYDLKKVDELDYFWDLMRKAPGPQLSEPGHGSLLQPRLIAMRHPILRDGQLTGVVSLMIRTKAFLKATGLDRVAAYRIVCRGQEAESAGELGDDYRQITVQLPANEWLIQYR